MLGKETDVLQNVQWSHFSIGFLVTYWKKHIRLKHIVDDNSITKLLDWLTTPEGKITGNIAVYTFSNGQFACLSTRYKYKYILIKHIANNVESHIETQWFQQIAYSLHYKK